MGAEQQYVVFRLMGQLFGAAIDVVREVNHLTAVTRLPNTPEYVEGVIDLRGEVLPVISLRRRLGLPAKEADADTRLMVLSLGERSAALVVDGVDQVLTLNQDEIVPPDAHVVLPGKDYVTGLARSGESLVVILNLARLMSE
ncbi:MAG TPA: chemotaxis protein CheW [Symbiobacteriaceae bacterium]|jgi:purine-binding chemotaxis protein CheW|nr:chemotaxis protein CheW [Symbiobacteriaceae bacterium]